MNKIDELLEHVQKTNPGMTKEKLKKELQENRYTRNSLFFTMKSVKNVRRKN